MTKYGVFSGPYFPVFRPNTEIHGMNTGQKNSVFGHFSRREIVLKREKVPKYFVQDCRSDDFIVNFENISHLVLVFLSVPLRR